MIDTSRVWEPDFLEGFERTALGEATLVRPTGRLLPRHPKAAVLHVHGWNDYFFHEHVVREFVKRGYAYYAVDLPRAGRSLRPRDTPHYMRSIVEPGRSIGAAVAAVAELHPELRVVVHAHSTGALSAAVWAADHPHPALAALVLNGPLLDFRFGRSERLQARILPVIAAVAPRAVVHHAPSAYAHHQHRFQGGRWHFDTSLKRPVGVPVRAAWLNAASRAHRRIARSGLGIGVPVFVAVSATSGPDDAANPLIDRQDTVLDTAAVARVAPRLGPDVTVLEVPDAVHDLTLSADAPRRLYLDAVFEWLEEKL